MGRAILSPRQVTFLEITKASPSITEVFTLSGGTALAAFYLHHRLSEDLDFFGQEEVDPLAIETFLKANQGRIGYKFFEFQHSFNRNLFLLHFDDETLKTEFTYYPFTPLEAGMVDGLLRIDSLRDIAVNKVFTISQQTRLRDFIDLFFIIQQKGWSLDDLLKDARIKFDAHIDMVQFGAQLVKVQTLQDMPRMVVDFDINAIRTFFLAKALRLKERVLEK